MNKIIAASLIALCSASAFANQFVLTTSDAATKKGGQSFALDFVSNGDGTTLVVKVAIPDADKAAVDLSGCGRGLPKGFNGQCNVAKGNLIMVVSSDTNALLPKGTLSLGVFSVTYSDGAARKLTVSSTEVASPAAQELPSSFAQ